MTAIGLLKTKFSASLPSKLQLTKTGLLFSALCFIITATCISCSSRSSSFPFSLTTCWCRVKSFHTGAEHTCWLAINCSFCCFAVQVQLLGPDRRCDVMQESVFYAAHFVIDVTKIKTIFTWIKLKLLWLVWAGPCEDVVWDKRFFNYCLYGFNTREGLCDMCFYVPAYLHEIYSCMQWEWKATAGRRSDL